MTEKSDSLESQLDALAEKCEADDAGVPTPTDAEPSADAKDDLVGHDFADQVQRMLDEAAASINPETEDAPSPSQADADSDNDEDGASDEKLIAQIDDMLADAANEAIVGDFESVEDQEEVVDNELPADPAAFVASDDPVAEDGPSVEGDFQAVDDLEMEAVAESDDLADDDQAAELTEAAAAVAAELDADEALTGDFESPDDVMDDDDEPVIETVAARTAVSEPAAPPVPAAAPASPQQMQMPDEEDAEPGEPVGRPTRLVAILAKINQPIAGCSEATKNIVGAAALITLAIAVMCFLIAGLGRLPGLIVGSPIVMLVTLAALYFLVLRQDGNGNNEPTGA